MNGEAAGAGLNGRQFHHDSICLAIDHEGGAAIAAIGVVVRKAPTIRFVQPVAIDIARTADRTAGLVAYAETP